MRYLAAIAALGLLVAFHELGHLFFARLFRVQVDKFAVGFGPALLSFRARGIEWVVGAIPLGGYVRIRGMNPHEDGAADEGSFVKAQSWKRALILAGGSFANYALAVTIMFVLLLTGTHVPLRNTVGVVQPGSAAARAQLRVGDKIVAINGEAVTQWSQIADRVTDAPNVPLTFSIEREGVAQKLVLRPRPDGSGAGRIGVAEQRVLREHPLGEALILAFKDVHTRVGETFRLLSRLLSGKKGVQLASPVLIVKQGADVASLGADAFLRLLVGLSIALAIFNLLPVPALDGGRLLFVAIEAATGRPVNAKLETALHTAGFFALIGLFIFVAMRDVANLFAKPTQTGPPQLLTAVAGDGGVQPDAGRATDKDVVLRPDAGASDTPDAGAVAQVVDAGLLAPRPTADKGAQQP